jgi:hypothetical protein
MTIDTTHPLLGCPHPPESWALDPNTCLPKCDACDALARVQPEPDELGGFISIGPSGPAIAATSTFHDSAVLGIDSLLFDQDLESGGPPDKITATMRDGSTRDVVLPNAPDGWRVQMLGGPGWCILVYQCPCGALVLGAPVHVHEPVKVDDDELRVRVQHEPKPRPKIPRRLLEAVAWGKSKGPDRAPMAEFVLALARSMGCEEEPEEEPEREPCGDNVDRPDGGVDACRLPEGHEGPCRG